MTLYMLFAGLGMLIYTGVALAEAAVAGFSGAHVATGLQVAFLSILLPAAILFYANRLLGARSSRADRTAAWRRRIGVAALMFFAGGVAVLIAATREPDDALVMCTGQCSAGDEPIAGEASLFLPTGSQAAMVGSESARAAGRALFQKRGCVGCHRSDGTGAGPTLHGLFGSPVQDPACGVAIVDESYVREAILNPSATVVLGFPPVMPTFAGQLTEEELQALIVYVKSLTVPVQVQRQ